MNRALVPFCSCRAALRRAASAACIGLALPALLMSIAVQEVRAQQPSDGFNITGVTLGNFRIDGNVLTAGQGTVSGTLAGLPFTTQITNFALQTVADDPATQQVECSILHLELAPIHLNLLGLHVDTSAICLDLTATEGGGLLGDLLCSLAGGGALGTGIPLLPTDAQVSTLEAGLVDIIGGAMDENLVPAQDAEDSVCTGQCEILELVLGPVNLSLLGLNVSLDDCADGPVQVCVSATRGEGLLGNLLCGLSGADVINLTLADIAQLNRRAVALLADGTLSKRDAGELTALLGRLIR